MKHHASLSSFGSKPYILNKLLGWHGDATSEMLAEAIRAASQETRSDHLDTSPVCLILLVKPTVNVIFKKSIPIIFGNFLNSNDKESRSAFCFTASFQVKIISFQQGAYCKCLHLKRLGNSSTFRTIFPTSLLSWHVNGKENNGVFGSLLVKFFGHEKSGPIFFDSRKFSKKNNSFKCQICQFQPHLQVADPSKKSDGSWHASRFGWSRPKGNVFLLVLKISQKCFQTYKNSKRSKLFIMIYTHKYVYIYINTIYIVYIYIYISVLQGALER